MKLLVRRLQCYAYKEPKNGFWRYWLRGSSYYREVLKSEGMFLQVVITVKFLFRCTPSRVWLPSRLMILSLWRRRRRIQMYQFWRIWIYFLTEHAPALGPLSLFNCEFVFGGDGLQWNAIKRRNGPPSSYYREILIALLTTKSAVAEIVSWLWRRWIYFLIEHAPARGPLSLFSCEFVMKEMDIFSSRTRPCPGASESV